MSKEALKNRQIEAENNGPDGHGRRRSIGKLERLVSNPTINHLKGITLVSFSTSNLNATRGTKQECNLSNGEGSGCDQCISAQTGRCC